MNRQGLTEQTKVNNTEIARLQAENKELCRQWLLLSDDQYWYKEEMVTQGRGKKKTTRLFGMQCYNQDFKDEDTDYVVTIERHRVVKIDGEWVDGY